MIGPETTSTLSGTSAVAGFAGVIGAGAGTAAAFVTLETVVFPSSQPAISSPVPHRATASQIRMLPPPSLPPEPIPHLLVDPQNGSPEKYVPGRIPPDAHFASSFHPRANRCVVIWHCDPRIKDRRVVQRPRFRAYDFHVSVKGPHWVTVQLHYRLLPGL